MGEVLIARIGSVFLQNFCLSHKLFLVSCSYSETIRTFNCRYLVKDPRCQSCEEFRADALAKHGEESSPPKSSRRKSKPTRKILEMQDSSLKSRKRRHGDNNSPDEKSEKTVKVEIDAGGDRAAENHPEESIRSSDRKQVATKKSFSGKCCRICRERFRSMVQLSDHMMKVSARTKQRKKS